MKIFKLDAGFYYTDGGAMMGVNPWAIWGKSKATDERRRIKLALNLLLIVGHERVILVDTGIGNRLSDKQKQIYKPSDYILEQSLASLGYKGTEITDVILTHLHFDHAGGLITSYPDADRATFPNAQLWCQKSEWEMAKNPDGLNRAAYNYPQQLEALEGTAKIRLIDGELEIAPGIRVKKVGGHSVGSQIVEIDSQDGFYIYPADIIPTKFHLSLAITSAYDVNRKESFLAKSYIHERLKEKEGNLLLNHDTEHWEMRMG